jgi:hypothetical protein
MFGQHSTDMDKVIKIPTTKSICAFINIFIVYLVELIFIL